MKFTYAWLRDHLDTEASLEEITERLTMIGLEVEGVENKAEELAPFTAARVVKAEPHPNADKLRVCEVEWTGGVEHVVCGAPNARTGMVGVFAPSGSYIPGSGMTLKPTKIRGVASNGMLVSEREMGISDEHEGIIELPEDTPLGTPLADILGLSDPVIEIAITPNRPDALGVHGVARDLAAAGLGRLIEREAEPVKGAFPSPIGVSRKFTAETASACSQFMGRYIRGVKNGPSPEWLQKRLRAIGLRPINALVDMTNFMAYDRGRPLHVFDAGKLRGDIHARLAEKGEKLLALDGKTYALDETMCVICDDSGVVGIGGVMGGDETGSTDETTDVFIECAYFDPLRIARTGRELNIVSDARYRFERGVDPTFLPQAMELATRLVLDMCGGEASDVVNAGQAPVPEREIELPVSEVKRLTGLDVKAEESRTILEALGFGVRAQGTDGFTVRPPSWRPDVEGKADLVEEIIRIKGLDEVPSSPLPRTSAVTRPALTETQDRLRRARRCLASRGLHEAATWSFIPRAHAELFGGANAVEALTLANPISSDLDTMRPSMLPGLIAAAGRNMDRAMSHVAMFEAGPQFAGLEPEEQARAVTGIRRGAGRRHWAGPPRDPDVFDVKADALAVLEACSAPVGSVQVTDDAPAWYHPGRSGTVRLGPKTVLAWFGEIHPRVLDAMDVKGPLMAFEIFPEHIPAPKRKGKARPPLDAPDLLPVERDFAFVVDRGVSADALVRAARGAEKKLIEDVRVFDLYEGPGVPEGKKSLAIEVRLQPREKTLTDEEIDAVSAKIVAQVKKATGGELRG